MNNTQGMTLRQARCAYSLALAHLIIYANEHGYEVAIDEVTDRVTDKDPTTDHRPGSLHEVGLAADLNLYLDGRYLSETAEHLPLGEEWERYGRKHNLPLAWGGRFNDGNHYSMAWKGKK